MILGLFYSLYSNSSRFNQAGKNRAVFGVVNIELVHGDSHIGIGGATQFLLAFLEDSCSSNGELKPASGDPVAI